MSGRAATGTRLVVVTGLILGGITLVQLLVRSAISRDEMENIRWGQMLAWGTEKHPPLFGWIHYGWVELLGRSDLATFVLEKLAFALGLALLYLLLKPMLARERVILALALTLATANAVLLVLKFNGNSAQWPVWAAYLLCLQRAVTSERATWWLATGLAAGAAVLTKYHAFLLFACSLGWLLSRPEGRRALAGWRPWAGVALALLVVAPHLVWLFRHGAPTLGYAAANIGAAEGVAAHVLEPLVYVLEQALFLCPALLVFAWWLRRGRPARGASTTPSDLGFLFWHGPVLGLAPAIASLVAGLSLGSMWGLASWGLLPAWAIARFELAASGPRVRQALVAALATAGLYALIAVVHGGLFAVQLDYKGTAAAVRDAWYARYQAPLAIAGGDGRYYEGLTVYAPEAPDVFGMLDPGLHPRVTPARMAREGAVIVIPERLEDSVARARQRFPVEADAVVEVGGWRRGLVSTRSDRLLLLFVAPAVAGAGGAPGGPG